MDIQEADVRVPEGKLEQYLLSTSHPHGRSKAVLFLNNGYGPEKADTLREQFLRVFRNGTLEDEIESEYGMKYVISGVIRVKEEKKAKVTTVWIDEAGTDYVRFVTAYPAGVD